VLCGGAELGGTFGVPLIQLGAYAPWCRRAHREIGRRLVTARPRCNGEGEEDDPVIGGGVGDRLSGGLL